MSFLNVPLKAIQANLIYAVGIASAPWHNPLVYPVIPPGLPPPTQLRDFQWRVVLEISSQQHSAYNTRAPGEYNGQDVAVGQWIANATTGQAWKIISIESKSSINVVAIVEDAYRYNIFRDFTQVGNGIPGQGVYIIFSVTDVGVPLIDPVPPAGVSSAFGINLQSRFEYINLQYDYPLYQENNSFVEGDVIAVSSTANSFVLADNINKLTIGRATSSSNIIPGWFTINPVQKIVDNLDYLPGNIGDILYVSLTNPGELTTTPGGSEVYIKLRNNTSSISYSTDPGPTTPNNIFQLNGQDVDVGVGTPAAIISSANLLSLLTGVSATSVLYPSSVQTSNVLITPVYGEPALWAISSPAVATINGIPVTFNITSTDIGYTNYARPAQMAQSINAANIPNIVASSPSTLILLIENISGGPINIANITPDINGVAVSGSASGTGLVSFTPASTVSRIKFTAVDARPINFLNVVGSVVEDYGLESVENGVKAVGLYIQSGLRTAETTVVPNLAALYALSPLIGDQAYVIDSNDGNGNNVNEWSMWLYDGVSWVETSNQNSSKTDAKSLEYTLTTSSPSTINIGEISTGRRVTLITVEVGVPFDGLPSLNIGYQVNNPVPPPPVPAGLMVSSIIDLTVAGTYTTYTDILFGTDTVQGDVTVTADFVIDGATTGQAQIIVSYV